MCFNLIDHLYLLPRLRMSVAIPLLPVYPFMAHTKRLCVYFHKKKIVKCSVEF
jgi:hypothetical protein